MTDAPTAYGIDFGTTNSLVSAAYEDRVDLLYAEGDSSFLPSLLYLNREDVVQAGTTAVQSYGAAASAHTRCQDCSLAGYNGREWTSNTCRAVAQDGGCHNARLIGEIKRDLSEDLRDHTHSWGKDYRFSWIAGQIIRTLKGQADEVVGADVRRAVIGHPVAFAGTEGGGFHRLQRLAVDRLIEAGHEAGFDQVELLEEPAAAASREAQDGLIVVLDFGGGTFDVVVIDQTADTGVVRGMQGVSVGGEDFDEAIFREVLAEYFDLTGGDRQWLLDAVARRSAALRAPSSHRLLRELTRARRGGLKQLYEVLMGGFAFELFRSVEQAKVDLSSDDSARIAFDRPGIRIDLPVDRATFESLIADDLDVVMEQLDRALAQAGAAADDVDLVVRTGGSSSIPAFVDRLHDRFPEERIVQRSPIESIAVGLGIHAQKVFP